MRIHVRHRTVYRYDTRIDYTIQLLRLCPRDHEGQSVLGWDLRVPGRKEPLPVSEDGFGNIVHVHTVNAAHDETAVEIEGEAETSDTHGVVRGGEERLPPAFFLRPTTMTARDAAIEDLAEGAVAGASDDVERLHRLMDEVRRRIAYAVGASDATTTAKAALAKGEGVCQDHAHVFIAAAQSLGYPARYVSGYLWTGDNAEPYQAGHAWAEAYVEGLGWVGFDPANGVSPSDAYVRTAVGQDYQTAAPVRGLRRGLASEDLHVEVRIAAIASQQ